MNFAKKKRARGNMPSGTFMKGVYDTNDLSAVKRKI